MYRFTHLWDVRGLNVNASLLLVFINVDTTVPVFIRWLTGKVVIKLLLPVVAGAFLRRSKVAFRRRGQAADQKRDFLLEVVIWLTWLGWEHERWEERGIDRSGTPPGIAQRPQWVPLSTAGKHSGALLLTAVLKRHANTSALLTWHGVAVPSVKRPTSRHAEQFLS